MSRLKRSEKIAGLLFVVAYFTFSPYLLSYVFAVIVYYLPEPLPMDMIDPWFNVFYDGMMLAVGCFIFRSFIYKNIQRVKTIGIASFFKDIGGGFLLLYGTNFVLSLMMSFLAPELSSSNQTAIESMATYAPMQMFVSSVLLAPFLEELIFRVGIFQTMYEKSPGIAYVLSSFLFGLVHVIQGLLAGDLSQLIFLPSYAVLGATFAYMYEKNENFFVPMTVHMLNNLISYLVLL